MIRLIVNQQDGSGPFDIDLYEDETLPLVYNADDFTNVAEKSSNYSKSFSIPGTKNNNLVMELVFKITADSSFNPHLRTECIVRDDTVEIFNGYLQLNEIVKKEGTIQYEITIFSVSTNFKDSLGEKKLNDIDISELSSDELTTLTMYNQTVAGNLPLTNPLGSNSYAGAAGDTSTDVIRFPLVNYNNAGYYDNTTGKIISAGGTSDHLRPWIKVWYLLNNIIRDAGYTYTSAFLDSATFKELYVDLSHGNLEAGAPASGNALYDMFKATNPNATGLADSTFHLIDFTTITNISPNIIGSNFYNLATDLITFTFNTTIYVKFRFTPTWTGGGNKNFYVELSTTGTYLAATNSLPYTKAFYGKASGAVIEWGSQSWNWLGIAGRPQTGATLQLKIKSEPHAVSGSSANVSYAAGNYFQIGIGGVGFNYQAYLLQNKGEISQWDFTKSFIDMYNLMIVDDPDDKNNLLIEPYKDWITAGTERNWTNKMMTEEVKIVPIDGLARRLHFMHKEDDEDLIYDTQNNPVKNYYAVEIDTGIEIADMDEETIEIPVISNTFVSNYDGSTDFIVPNILAKNGDYSFDNVMRVLYNNGVINLSTDLIEIEDGTPGFIMTANKYNIFTPVSDHPVTSTSESVDFASVDYVYEDGGAVVDSLYNKYWSRYIDELYDPSTRIIECEMLLTNIDIFNHKFNDIIMIKNRKYRVLKIEYKPNTLSKVTLVLIKDL